jgi:hypothetical protein
MTASGYGMRIAPTRQKDMQDPEGDDLHHNSMKRYAHLGGTLPSAAHTYDGPQQAKKSSVDIHDPMFLWILLLMSAVVLRILLTDTAYIPQGTSYNMTALYSNFLLQFPGIVILPLIIGAVIGSEVGERSSTFANAMRGGLINGMYASIIYLASIVIIYIILNYTTPQFSTLYLTVLNSVMLPILVFMLTLEIFAALSYFRKVE